MRFVLCLLAALAGAATAAASPQNPRDDAIAKSEAAIGNVLPPLVFTDIDGKRIALSSLRGKPVLISMIYTACTDVCPAIISNLRPAIEIARDALGPDSFNVLTIGFDTVNDTPARMRSFARNQGIDLQNWRFLSGDKRSVDQLAGATGFTIVPSSGGFEHTAQVSVIDTNGRVFQQVLGGVFNPPAIVEPLKDVLFARRRPILSLAGIAERVKLFCTVYNPNTGRYYFNYSLFIGIVIGLASLALVLGWLVREFRLSGKSGGGAHP